MVRLLNTGDVIKTNPLQGFMEGYWGCAIVLATVDADESRAASCIVGITSQIFQHDYDFDELVVEELKILRYVPEKRVAPYMYEKDGDPETCIFKFYREIEDAVDVIGAIDVDRIADLKGVSREINKYRMHPEASVTGNLGSEAVHAWRAEFDREMYIEDLEDLEVIEPDAESRSDQWSYLTCGVEPMSAERFWAIVDEAAKHQRDEEKHIEALRAALSKLSAEDIQAYELAFDREMHRSYRWELWGADFVIHRFMSDDLFDYFRHWLISKGRTVFEATLENPDNLADFAKDFDDEIFEFEGFSYLAEEVWCEKMGQEFSTEDSYFIGGGIAPGHPEGQPFDEEDEVALQKAYPKLWALFGKNPKGLGAEDYDPGQGLEAMFRGS